MKKRLLFLVPAVAMLLAGCGKNGGDPTSTSGETPTSQQPTSGEQPTSTSGEQPTSQSGTPTEPGPGSSSSETPAPDVTPAKIIVNQTWCNLVVGGDPFTFTATVQNKDGSSEGVNQAVTWTIAEGDVGKYTCVDGVVTALQEGTNMELTVASVEVPTVTKVVKVTAKDPDMTLPSMTSDGFDKVATAELTQGDSVYFAGAYGKHAYVMGKYASGNNIAAKETTVAEEKLQITGELGAEAYLVEKNSDDTYSFKDSSNKYIYAADDNGSHNYLKAAEKASISDDREKFALTSEDGVLKLRSISDKATRNTLMLNGSSKIFSCYGSGQQDIVIYHKAPVVLSGIEVKTQPTKNSYFVGDEFSSAGLEVEAVYSDLHKELLTAEDYDLSIAEGKALVTGDSGPVTVTLKADNSKTCTFDITVAEIVLQSLEVSTPTKHEYVKGATFDPSTITVTAHYNDSRKDKVIPFKVGEEDGYTVLFDTSAAGTDKTVTVSYGGQEEVLEGFTVLDIEVVKIELISGPSSSLYYEGQPFDRTRIGVKATFNNETEDAEFEEYRVFPNRALTTSDNYVFIYFGDESLVEPTEGDLCFKLAVTVEEDSIAGIAVGTIPGSTQFSVGETFSKAALGNPTVIATHLSGKVDEPVVADSAQIHVGDEWLDEYTFTAYTDEHYTAHLVLDSIAVEFDVTMMDSVASVVVKEGSTHKVSFKSGETFSRENLVLHGVWYSGFEDDITSGFVTDLDGHVFTDTDVENSPLTVTVTYGNSVTCNYQVSITAPVKDILTSTNLETPSSYSEISDHELTDGVTWHGWSTTGSGDNVGAIQLRITDESSIFTSKSIKYIEKVFVKFKSAPLSERGLKLYGNNVAYTLATRSSGNELASFAEDGEFTLDVKSRYVSFVPFGGPIYVESITVQYSDDEVPATVTSVALNKNSASIGTSDSLTLIATVEGDGRFDKTVSWSTSEESVATVSNGVVTPVSAGTTVITATSNGDNTKFASCTVTVVAKELVSISIKTSPEKLTYCEGEYFNPSGLVISALYSNEEVVDVAYVGNESSFTFTPALNSALSYTDDNVSISYNSKLTNLSITVYELSYDLEVASTGTDTYSSGYDKYKDTTINSIDWRVTANSSGAIWYFGGKSITAVDRTLYSKTAIVDDISRILISFDTSNITINSITLVVSENSDFSSPVSEIDIGFVASSTVEVDKPSGKSWANCYYKLVFNLTNTTNSNKKAGLTRMKFYK